MQESAPKRPLLRIAGRLLSFACAGLAALIVWNAILGAAVGKTPGFHERPDMGRVMNAGAFVQSEEGFSRTKINSLGFRNPEIGPKAPGKKRVLCLGDSFTAGFQVGDGQTFVDGLRRRLGDSVEVINGGRDGVSPAAHLGSAEFYKTLAPDLVVFEISPNNLKGQMTDPAANFYVAREGDGYRVVRNTTYVGDSPFAQRFAKIKGVGALASVPCVKIAVHNLSLILKSTKEQDRREAGMQAPPDLCRWTVRALHERFPNLILVYVGQPAYFEPAPPDTQATVLGSEAKALGVPFLDMAPILEARYRKTGELANGFSNSDPGAGHINGLGHRLVADALAPLVREAL